MSERVTARRKHVTQTGVGNSIAALLMRAVGRVAAAPRR